MNHLLFSSHKPVPSSQRQNLGKQQRHFVTVLVALACWLFVAPASSTGTAWAFSPPPGNGMIQHGHRSFSITSTSLETTPYRLDALPDADRRLDDTFVRLMDILRRYGRSAAVRYADSHILLTPEQEMRFSLLLDTDDEAVRAGLSTRLTGLGARITPSVGKHLALVIPVRTLEASLQQSRLGFLDNLTALPHLAAVTISHLAVLDDEGLGTTAVPDLAAFDRDPLQSEGVHRIGADRWLKAGLAGKGVKIGVIDAGFNGYQKLLGTGLPRTIVLKPFNSSGDITGHGEKHGTAVAEIIHNTAPDARLYGVAYDTDEAWQAAINWLVAQGVKVISDSTSVLVGPRDDSSDRAQRVDRLRRQGILYFKSAGNYARQHYGGAFKADTQGFNVFSATGTKLVHISALAPSGFIIFLQWNDWHGTSQIFDLFLFDGNGNILDQSQNRRDSFVTEPIQAIKVDNPDQSTDYFIAIRAVHVTRPAHLDLFLKDAELETPVAAGSLGIPADARKAVTIGADNVSNDTFEVFSSQGPTEDGRSKPELAAPDSTSGQVYGRHGFPGTSAATPHAAAVAALIFSAFPRLGAEEVLQFMERNALHQRSYPNNTVGYGRVQLPPPSQR